MSSCLCCVVDCDTNVSKHRDVVLYDFPDKVSDRRRWIEAVKLANSEKPSWEPNSSCKICSEHFLGNRRSLNPDDPNSVPTIFPLAKQIIPKMNSEVCINVDDSDDYDSEVIEETSDCLFVVGKIKQEVEEEEKYSPKSSENVKSKPTRNTNGRKLWKPKAATKRKISRSSPANKKRISSVSKENVASHPQRTKVTSDCSEKGSSRYDGNKALFTGKFSSDSSDFDLDEDEFGEFYHDEGNEVSEKEFLSVSDKVKVALKTPSGPNEGHSEIDSEDYLLSMDEEVLLKKKSRRRKRKPARRVSSKSCQAALPGLCDGFVFCTSRDDDFNVGVQCNVLYELTLIQPDVQKSNSSDNRDVPKCAEYSLL